jgi:hypothetical protein
LVNNPIRDTGTVVPSLRGYGVEFIEEEYAGPGGFGTIEEITDRLLRSANVFVKDFGAFD